MQFDEFAAHTSNNHDPHCIGFLDIYQGEGADLRAICDKYGSAQIIGVCKVPLIPVVAIKVLCCDANAARALDEAWWSYCERSPHRPHGESECLAWGEQFNPFPNIPRDLRF